MLVWQNVVYKIYKWLTDTIRSGLLPYLLPSLYAAAFVRRTTSSTDLHPFLKRSLYLLRFNHFIVYTGCGTLLSYLHFYARTCKSIYRLITKTHPSMHIIVIKSKTHPSMHIIVLKSKTHRSGGPTS